MGNNISNKSKLPPSYDEATNSKQELPIQQPQDKDLNQPVQIEFIKSIQTEYNTQQKFKKEQQIQKDELYIQKINNYYNLNYITFCKECILKINKLIASAVSKGETLVYIGLEKYLPRKYYCKYEPNIQFMYTEKCVEFIREKYSQYSIRLIKQVNANNYCVIISWGDAPPKCPKYWEFK